jgi:hypothetical protein
VGLDFEEWTWSQHYAGQPKKKGFPNTAYDDTWTSALPRSRRSAPALTHDHVPEPGRDPPGRALHGAGQPALRVRRRPPPPSRGSTSGKSMPWQASGELELLLRAVSERTRVQRKGNV